MKYDSFTAAEITKVNLETEAFKAQLREDHIYGQLRREVLAGLRSRNGRRSGPLSLLLPGEGTALGFVGTPTTQHYAEGKLPLGTLDPQLGPRWDVLVRSEGGSRYVASVTLKLGMDWVLHFAATYATCHNPVPLDGQYRVTLARDIQACDISDATDYPLPDMPEDTGALE